MSTKATKPSEAKETQVFEMQIERVLTSDLLDRNRITLVLSDEIISLNEKGEEKQTNTISINSGQIANVVTNCEELEMWHILAMGQPLNKKLFALLCPKALIKFEREYLPVGYVTQKGEKLTKATYKTNVLEVTINANSKFMAMANKIAATQLEEPKKVVAVDADDLF